ncbi:MAG: YgiT-type zinc finger protein [Deltaproteobacteria bacterium]|nr:YgiT-type zinc finger protein [Deltaproteobacteria bacterium]
MSARKPPARRCVACGQGALERRTRSGRVDVYKGMELPLPADLPLVECVACGERYVTAADAERIDRALSAAYTRQVRTRIEKDIETLRRHDVSLASVERALGLSEGYLSKIRKSVEPSFQVVALLALVAADPRGTLQQIGSLRTPPRRRAVSS